MYGQRWQAERAFSRLKRRLGAAVAALRWAHQKPEALLRAFAHNLMLRAAKVSTKPHKGRGQERRHRRPQADSVS